MKIAPFSLLKQNDKTAEVLDYVLKLIPLCHNFIPIKEFAHLYMKTQVCLRLTQ